MDARTPARTHSRRSGSDIASRFGQVADGKPEPSATKPAADPAAKRLPAPEPRRKPFRQTTILDVDLHDWLDRTARAATSKLGRGDNGRVVSMNHVLRAALRAARSTPGILSAIEDEIRADRLRGDES